MKKTLLTLFAFVAVTTSINAQTDAFKKAPVQFDFNAKKAVKAPSNAEQADNQVWWGYVQDNGYRTALGTGSTGIVDQAILISKDNSAVAGNTIKAIRFYLRDLSAISDVKVWISTTLPSSANNANVLVQSVPNSELQGGDEGDYYMGKLNEVQLTSPYTVTQNVYVGYSYNVTSAAASAGQYPIVLSDEEGVSGSLYLHTPNISWDSYESYGPLDLRVLVEGEFSQNAATPGAIDEVITVLGKQATINLPVTNGGQAGISSLDYVISVDGVAGEEQHVELPQPYNIFGGTTNVEIAIDADTETGTQQKTLTITKVNGADNEANNNSIDFAVTTLTKIVSRGIAVEEFTGTTCGWCPRGLVGMEMLREAYGDLFVGIGVHQYNSSDAMYIATNAYAKLGFSGAPSCALQRKGIIDPYYGSTNNNFHIAQDFESIS